MRHFIAINFNDETKELLLQIQDQIAKFDDYANFSRPENLHLTLAFLVNI